MTAQSTSLFAQNLNDYTDEIIMLILDRQAFKGQLKGCWELHDACEVALTVGDSLLNIKSEIIDLQIERIDLLSEEVETLEDKIKRRNRWLMFSGVALLVSIIL